jgi:uncharacterized protein
MTRLLSSLKGLYSRFIRIRGNPREIALGFALGIFIGMTPTMGIQIILAIFFAALLKWNKISATIAVFITNPFTAPFIYGTTYLVGARVLGLQKIFKFPEQMSFEAAVEMLKSTPRIFGALTVGGVLIGLPLAIIAYFGSYLLIVKTRKNLQKVVEIRKSRSQDVTTDTD